MQDLYNDGTFTCQAPTDGRSDTAWRAEQ